MDFTHFLFRRIKIDNTNNFLKTEKESKLILKYSLPCVISLLVGALYNIVDQVFIANADYLGSFGNSANTVVFPLTVIALAITVMLGDGCCAFISIVLGKNKKEEAEKSLGNLIVVTIVLSIILMIIYLLFSNQIITIFGGKVNEETFNLSKEYFFWITLGIPFYMLGQALNPIIRADGNPKYAMIVTLSGSIVNLLLDPIMIFGLLGLPKMGMAGAAIATIIGQMVSFSLSIGYLFNTKIIKVKRNDFILKSNIL